MIFFSVIHQGLIHEVFILIMRGLSGAKVTRPGKFRSCQDGYAVKSSLKAEDGVLYPLEKGFFFLPKPPTLILHEEVTFWPYKCFNPVAYYMIDAIKSILTSP